jgi:hypothetical protein
MSTSQPRKNLKIPAADYAYLDRVAAEDGEASVPAYVRKLIAADRLARARAEAAAFLADLTERHGAPDDGPAELLAAAVRLHELMTGTPPDMPLGTAPLAAVRIALAQVAARALVDGAEHEYRTGDDLALGAFLTTLAADPRVTVERIGAAAGAIANILTALIDLLGERELVNAATPRART